MWIAFCVRKHYRYIPIHKICADLEVVIIGGNVAVSSGNVTDDVIAEYIKNQDEIERHKNDNFSVGF